MRKPPFLSHHVPALSLWEQALFFKRCNSLHAPAHVVQTPSEKELHTGRVPGWVLEEAPWCLRTALQNSALYEVVPICIDMGPGLAFCVQEARFLGADSEESMITPNKYQKRCFISRVFTYLWACLDQSLWLTQEPQPHG